jgi:two-component system LytT family response regulator
MKLRAILIDDEPLARERLRQLLDADIEIVAECANGVSAITEVRAKQPDVLLLDIRMPDMDGFAVVEALGARAPWVILTTAYDEHAVRAFEARALDYLLKPISRTRLREALARVREGMAAGKSPERRLAVRDGANVTFVRIGEVNWIEAAGNYALVHAGAATHILRDTMSALEERLPHEAFLRVSRSAIVNLNHVRALLSEDGLHYAVLDDGGRIAVTRSLREVQQRVGAG